MDLQKQQFTIEIAGQVLKLEISQLAGQANAAVLGTYGDTSVLIAATMSSENRTVDYLPLTIDYEERFYAAGKIIGSRFIRREGRPSEEAILSGRLIDRSLRPLFDQRLRRDIQIVITVLSYDEENDPTFAALISASTALAISNIPWNGPVAGVRLARFSDGRTIINPVNSTVNSTVKNGDVLNCEAFVAGTSEKINMIELAGNEAGEDGAIEAFDLAHQEIKKLVDFQRRIIKEVGKQKISYINDSEEEKYLQMEKKIREFLKDGLEAAVYTAKKADQNSKIAVLKQNLFDYLKQEGFEAGDLSKAESLFEKEIDSLVHQKIIESDKRPDGRRLDEIRGLYGEVSLFKRLHGSGLFIRGDTQSLAVVTLAPPGAEQLVESMEGSAKRRFMLHYNFPPYCVGEIGRLGQPNRREIGHGALAEKALKPLIPSQDEFPYTIRVVSEILSSNGSSSMATVCASSLALMDAGVPLKGPAAGIAMGLMLGSDNRYKILTDIQGPEDHYGDMDCKVAGTTDGVTAIQMDVKIDGLTLPILKEVLAQAKKARLEILGFIKGVIKEPRPAVSSYAPVVMMLNIKPEQIGEVIGPGGRIINNIIQVTGASTIDIDQSGKIFISAIDQEKVRAAVQYIETITRQFQVGETVEGEIIKILDFGAIVNLGGDRDGMIHVSELKNGYVEKVEDVVKIGDRVRAKVIRVDPDGRIGLSLKAVNNK